VEELLAKMRGTGVQVEEMAVPQRRPASAATA